MNTIFDFQKKFPDENACFDYFYEKRWPNGFSCPRCSNSYGYKLVERRLTQCTRCKYQASVTAGTIFHKMRLPLASILWACFWIATSKNGISALELQRKLGIKSYPTAHALGRKIRQALKSSDKFPIDGNVELDEMMLYLVSQEMPTKKGELI